MKTPQEVLETLNGGINLERMFFEALMAISEEIRAVAELVKTDPSMAQKFIQAIIATRSKGEDIYVKGVGRSGSIGDMWALRAMTILGQKTVFIIGEKTTPKVIGGLLLTITGSGETKEVVTELEDIKEKSPTTDRFVITSTPGSKAWNLATSDESRINLEGVKDSVFPLRTSPEVRVLGFLEASAIVLKKLFDVSEEEMSGRHP